LCVPGLIFDVHCCNTNRGPMTCNTNLFERSSTSSSGSGTSSTHGMLTVPFGRFANFLKQKFKIVRRRSIRDRVIHRSEAVARRAFRNNAAIEILAKEGEVISGQLYHTMIDISLRKQVTGNKVSVKNTHFRDISINLPIRIAITHHGFSPIENKPVRQLALLLAQFKRLQLQIVFVKEPSWKSFQTDLL